MIEFADLTTSEFVSIGKGEHWDHTRRSQRSVWSGVEEHSHITDEEKKVKQPGAGNQEPVKKQTARGWDPRMKFVQILVERTQTVVRCQLTVKLAKG